MEFMSISSTVCSVCENFNALSICLKHAPVGSAASISSSTAAKISLELDEMNEMGVCRTHLEMLC